MRGPALSAETLALPGTGSGPAVEAEVGPEKPPTMETGSLENMNPAIVRMIMDMGNSKEEAIKIYWDQYAAEHVGFPNGVPGPKSSEITTKLYEEDGDNGAKIGSHRVGEAELSVKEEKVDDVLGLEVEIEDEESEGDRQSKEEHDREHKRPSALAALKVVSPEDQQPSKRRGRAPTKGKGRGRGRGRGRKQERSQ